MLRDQVTPFQPGPIPIQGHACKSVTWLMADHVVRGVGLLLCPCSAIHADMRNPAHTREGRYSGQIRAIRRRRKVRNSRVLSNEMYRILVRKPLSIMKDMTAASPPCPTIVITGVAQPCSCENVAKCWPTTSAARKKRKPSIRLYVTEWTTPESDRSQSRGRHKRVFAIAAALQGSVQPVAANAYPPDLTGRISHDECIRRHISDDN